jgi:hypothetical protein
VYPQIHQSYRKAGARPARHELSGACILAENAIAQVAPTILIGPDREIHALFKDDQQESEATMQQRKRSGIENRR